MTHRLTRISSPTRLASASLVLLGLLVAGPGFSQSPAHQPIKIESLHIENSADAATLEISTTGTVRWVASHSPLGDLVLHLRDSVPGPALAPLQLPSGLVARVTPQDSDATPPSVEIAIRTRGRTSYAISASDTRVKVSIRAIPDPMSPPASPEPGSSAPAADDARIGPGDLLQIDFFGIEELDRKVRVVRDGTISLPLLGSLKVADLTVSQAASSIAGMLAKQKLVNDPQVSVFVAEFVSHTVSIQGAVQRPDVYPLKGRSTLLDVLGVAGGLSSQHGDQIFILRNAENAAQGVGPQRIEIDAQRLINEGDYTLNVALKPGDIVMVPRARALRVYVNGAVRRPGPVEYSSGEGITVLQAITAAGGRTARANLKNVHVIRNRPNGGQDRIKVNIKKIQAGKAEDLVLERNDTVVVGEWFL